MNWIKDVTLEIKSLDLSVKALRKFGITVGGIFLVFGILLFLKSIWSNARVIFILIGFILFVGGIFYPKRLSNFYKVWMGLAFAIGWGISRFILVILFIFVLTPIGVLAKIFGKQFLDLKFQDGKKSYWLTKEKRKIDYEKMY
ncbi:MAG: SxtJ family membrane protein [Ignavibacteriales bacterium]|nr:SxtJ family membrane protein [Ignavibacteriales bacterium]